MTEFKDEIGYKIAEFKDEMGYKMTEFKDEIGYKIAEFKDEMVIRWLNLTLHQTTNFLTGPSWKHFQMTN